VYTEERIKYIKNIEKILVENFFTPQTQTIIATVSDILRFERRFFKTLVVNVHMTPTHSTVLLSEFLSWFVYLDCNSMQLDITKH